MTNGGGVNPSLICMLLDTKRSICEYLVYGVTLIASYTWLSTTSIRFCIHVQQSSNAGRSSPISGPCLPSDVPFFVRQARHKEKLDKLPKHFRCVLYARYEIIRKVTFLPIHLCILAAVKG